MTRHFEVKDAHGTTQAPQMSPQFPNFVHQKTGTCVLALYPPKTKREDISATCQAASFKRKSSPVKTASYTLPFG